MSCYGAGMTQGSSHRVPHYKSARSQRPDNGVEYTLEEEPPPWLSAAFAAQAIGQAETMAWGAYPSTPRLRPGIAFDLKA